ncbi:MAG: MBL fold metallo-hydrolase [Candidatus Omnitrophica bacterium]|nr:MBL fold metallo-hydrolase [Candidatus Omnitrophota bacterium]
MSRIQNKITAMIAVVAMIFSPLYGIPSGMAAPAVEVSVETSFHLDIPAELGTVDTLSAGAGPVIIQIQEAHGNYEVQKKIQAILHHLKDKYQINLLLLEGDADRLHPELLDFVPGRADLNLQIAEELAKKSVLSGPELFLAKEQEVEAYGIEEPDTYAANGQAFVNVLTQKEKTQNFLDEMNLQIERLTSPYMNKDLRHFLKRLDDYEQGFIPLNEWLNSLKTLAEKNLNLNLNNPWFQTEWPQLLRVFTLQAFEDKIDRNALENEQKTFLKITRHFLPETVYAQVQELLSAPLSQNHLADPGTRNLFEQMISCFPPDFAFERYPNVNLFIGHLILQSEIDGVKLMKELSLLTDEISDKLSHDEKEKEIVLALKKYKVLKRLFRLELMPDDYETAFMPEMRPSAMTLKFSHLNDDARVRNAGFVHLDDIDKLYDQALEFYRGVKERDQSMLKNIESMLKDSEDARAVVITGGFHTAPFRKFFKDQNYNYALITPKMTQIDKSQPEYVRSTIDHFMPPQSTVSATRRLNDTGINYLAMLARLAFDAGPSVLAVANVISQIVPAAGLDAAQVLNHTYAGQLDAPLQTWMDLSSGHSRLSVGFASAGEFGSINTTTGKLKGYDRAAFQSHVVEPEVGRPELRSGEAKFSRRHLLQAAAAAAALLIPDIDLGAEEYVNFNLPQTNRNLDRPILKQAHTDIQAGMYRMRVRDGLPINQINSTEVPERGGWVRAGDFRYLWSSQIAMAAHHGKYPVGRSGNEASAPKSVTAVIKKSLEKYADLVNRYGVDGILPEVLVYDNTGNLRQEPRDVPGTGRGMVYASYDDGLTKTELLRLREIYKGGIIPGLQDPSIVKLADDILKQTSYEKFIDGVNLHMTFLKKDNGEIVRLPGTIDNKNTEALLFLPLMAMGHLGENGLEIWRNMYFDWERRTVGGQTLEIPVADGGGSAWTQLYLLPFDFENLTPSLWRGKLNYIRGYSALAKQRGDKILLSTAGTGRIVDAYNQFGDKNPAIMVTAGPFHGLILEAGQRNAETMIQLGLAPGSRGYESGWGPVDAVDPATGKAFSGNAKRIYMNLGIQVEALALPTNIAIEKAMPWYKVMLGELQREDKEAALAFEAIQKPTAQRAAQLAEQVPLTNAGYRIVAGTGDVDAVKVFIRRLLSRVDEGNLSGLALFYTAEVEGVERPEKGRGKQTIWRLVEELDGFDWAEVRPEILKIFKPAREAEKTSSTGKPQTPQSARALAETAPLTETGYKDVSKTGDVEAVKVFIKRIAVITDEGELSGLAPFYTLPVTGVSNPEPGKSMQTLRRLKEELQTKPWARLRSEIRADNQTPPAGIKKYIPQFSLATLMVLMGGAATLLAVYRFLDEHAKTWSEFKLIAMNLTIAVIGVNAALFGLSWLIDTFIRTKRPVEDSPKGILRRHWLHFVLTGTVLGGVLIYYSARVTKIGLQIKQSLEVRASSHLQNEFTQAVDYLRNQNALDKVSLMDVQYTGYEIGESLFSSFVADETQVKDDRVIIRFDYTAFSRAAQSNPAQGWVPEPIFDELDQYILAPRSFNIENPQDRAAFIYLGLLRVMEIRYTSHIYPGSIEGAEIHDPLVDLFPTPQALLEYLASPQSSDVQLTMEDLQKIRFHAFRMILYKNLLMFEHIEDDPELLFPETREAWLLVFKEIKSGGEIIGWSHRNNGKRRLSSFSFRNLLTPEDKATHQIIDGLIADTENGRLDPTTPEGVKEIQRRLRDYLTETMNIPPRRTEMRSEIRPAQSFHYPAGDVNVTITNPNQNQVATSAGVISVGMTMLNRNLAAGSEDEFPSIFVTPAGDQWTGADGSNLVQFYFAAAANWHFHKRKTKIVVKSQAEKDRIYRYLQLGNPYELPRVKDYEYPNEIYQRFRREAIAIADRGVIDGTLQMITPEENMVEFIVLDNQTHSAQIGDVTITYHDDAQNYSVEDAALTEPVTTTLQAANLKAYDVQIDKVEPLTEKPGFGLTFLGTSGGMDIKGLTSNQVVWAGGKATLIDAGAPTVALLEQLQIQPADMANIVLTHMHEDHVAGALQFFEWMKQAGQEVNLVMEAGIAEFFIEQAELILNKKLEAEYPNVHLKRTKFYAKIRLGDPADPLQLTLIPAFHGTPTPSMRFDYHQETISVSSDTTMAPIRLDAFSTPGMPGIKDEVKADLLRLTDYQEGDIVFSRDRADEIQNALFAPNEWGNKPKLVVFEVGFGNPQTVDALNNHTYAGDLTIYPEADQQVIVTNHAAGLPADQQFLFRHATPLNTIPIRTELRLALTDAVQIADSLSQGPVGRVAVQYGNRLVSPLVADEYGFPVFQSVVQQLTINLRPEDNQGQNQTLAPWLSAFIETNLPALNKIRHSLQTLEGAQAILHNPLHRDGVSADDQSIVSDITPQSIIPVLMLIAEQSQLDYTVTLKSEEDARAFQAELEKIQSESHLGFNALALLGKNFHLKVAGNARSYVSLVNQPLSDEQIPVASVYGQDAIGERLNARQGLARVRIRKTGNGVPAILMTAALLGKLTENYLQRYDDESLASEFGVSMSQLIKELSILQKKLFESAA